MRMSLKTTLAAAAAALAITGCGAATAASGTSPAQPVNPVTVVRQAGATPSPGEVYGSRDVEGNLYASGSIPGPDCTGACGELVTVYTVMPGQTVQQLMAGPPALVPSDSQAVITTPDAIVLVTPVDVLTGAGGLTYFVPPAVIAARVHGTVVEPAS